MKYIDLHCDTLMKVRKESDLYTSNNHLDFYRLTEGNCLAQFFAVFLKPKPSKCFFYDEKKIWKKDNEYIFKKVGLLKSAVHSSGNINMAYNYHDLISNQKNAKISAFLTIEDGRSIGEDLSNIRLYYDLGIRLITITWNSENSLAYPHSKNFNSMNLGLKKFGIEAIEYMNELGIIIDASHISDKGFYDIAKFSNKPFVASHSNSRYISPSTRNLDDNMIKTLASKGGVMGLNFFSKFLSPNTKSKNSNILDMVAHLNHIKNVGGEDVLSIGSDFDGIRCQLEINSPSKVYLLFDELKKSKWTENQIEKLAYKNCLRVIKDTMN